MDGAAVRSALSKGPKLGKELYRETGLSVFELWRISHLKFRVATVGRRYLRFDKNVDGFARLSPAIEREFLTYSVVGLKKEKDAVERRAKSLDQEIREISARKMRLAQNLAMTAAAGMEKGVCFVIGGDVPLGMAHEDPRPESSTGELVAGSDLDLIIVVSDSTPQEQIDELDERLYKEKFSLLKNTQTKEEVDYLVKRFTRVTEQARFDSFENMVACKILNEGMFLHGDREIYESILKVLRQNSIPSKLSELEKIAISRRREAEAYLMKKGRIGREECMRLFTTSGEFSEVF